MLRGAVFRIPLLAITRHHQIVWHWDSFLVHIHCSEIKCKQTAAETRHWFKRCRRITLSLFRSSCQETCTEDWPTVSYSEGPRFDFRPCGQVSRPMMSQKITACDTITVLEKPRSHPWLNGSPNSDYTYPHNSSESPFCLHLFELWALYSFNDTFQ